MSVLILYATVTGSTEKCAEALKAQLKTPCTLVNITKENPPALEQFDKIVLGTPIRVGMVNRKIKKFCEKHLDALLKKKVALYICCVDNSPMGYFDRHFSKALLSHCFAAVPLGGEMVLENAKGFDKWVIKIAMKMLQKKGMPLPTLSEEAILRLAEKIEQA